MQVENGIQLTATNPLQFKERKHATADDIENPSIAFRILNKHHRLRLSSNEIDYAKFPGKTNLFAVANKKGCFVTAVKQHDSFYLVCSPLKDLQDSIESGKSPSPPFIPFPFQSQSSIKLPGTPCHVAVALNDERVLVGILDSTVLIYDLSKLLIKESQSDPVFIIPAKSSFPVGNISPNRGENPELVAILRCSSNEQEGYQVEIFNVATCNSVVTWRRGENPNLIPVSVSWSPKGKQIAIGLQSGGFLLYNPHDPGNPKNYILKSPIVPEDAPSLLSITWIATNTFYLVFSSAESCFPSFDRSNASSVAKTHVILVYDPKAHTGTDIEVSDPTPPFGAAFPPGQLCCVLKDWVPSKFLLVCGDGPSTDIGVIGSTSDENWSHYSLEETSTPALPLGEGAEDMALLGLDIDFTSNKPVRISEQPDDGTPDLPPSPILYAYMSDGSLVAWHILLLDGTPFPGMIKSVQSIGDSAMTTTALVSESQSSEAVLSSGGPSQSSAIAPAKGFGAFSSQQPSIFGSTSTTPISNPSASPSFGSGFSKPPAPAFGVTGWGFGSKPPASTSAPTGFGNTNATASTSVFGQTGFANPSSNAPKPSTVPSGGGFAAFAQGGTSSFGAPLGAAKVSVFNQPSAPSTQVPESTSRPAFGFGGKIPPTESSKPTSIFAAKVPDTSTPSSTFGSKPTDTSSTSSLFGTKDNGAGKASYFGTGQSDAMDVKLFDTMSSLGGSLKDAIAGSPPASPTMEESPSGSPISETADLPKPMSSYFKGDAGSKSPPTTSADSKPMSSFIRPGFGAFKPSSGTLPPPPSSVKPAEMSQSRTVTENNPAGSAFAPGKPVFGVSNFGTKPAIPAFGVSGFGQALSAPTKPEPAKPSAPSTGGFSAFATGGFTSFAKPVQASSFDDLLRQGNLKTSEPTFGAPAKPSSASIFGGILPAAPSAATPATAEKEKGGEKKITPASTTQTPDSKKNFPDSSASETSETDIANEPSAGQTEARAPGPGPLINEPKPEKTAIARVESAKSEEAKTEEPSKEVVSKPVELPYKADETSPIGPRPVTSFPGTGSIGTATSPTALTIGTNKSPLSIHLASSPTLVATPQSPHPSGLGIGLGRPSSRPARSSPLASTPITLGEEETAPVAAPQERNIPSKPAAPLSPLPSQPGLFSWKPEMKNDFFKTNDTIKPPPLGTGVPVPSVSKPTSPMATSSPFFAPTKSDAEIVKSKQSPDAGMHPLQVEFIRIYEESCNELRDLEKRLEALKALFPAIQVPRGLDKLVKNNEDFVPGKYSFGDLDFFKTLLLRLREKVIPLLDEGKSDKLRLAELQNLALISETKREELSRWFKAKEDPDFAKTLKPKSLGPEHTENQLRLRKLLQNTLTRLQQCEDMMEALQKKLNQEKSGRGVFQAPTLDTIDRTCRNIKLALDERTEMVDRLGERMETILPRRRSHPMDMGASLSSPSPIPFANLAVAALNSERSCLSLKSALFSARQRPLFTEKIVKAPPSAQTRASDATSIPSWNSSSFVHVNTPATSTSPGSSHLNSESTDRRRQSRKHTSIAVPLKNSGGEETRPPAASFDWGPLPTLTSTAAKKLPFEFKTSVKEPA